MPKRTASGMNVTDFPIWEDCPFEVPGVEVRRGKDDRRTEVVIFNHLETEHHVDLLFSAWTPGNVDLALRILADSCGRAPFKRFVRVS